MRISLKKFTSDPYKYAKKAPLIIVLGDDPAYALIPYVTYKMLIANTTQGTIANTQPKGTAHLVETKKNHGWLYTLLFS